jgi:tetratricopeptide (TPR) repeat protein
MNADYKSLLWGILRRAVPAGISIAIGSGLLLAAQSSGAPTMFLGMFFFLIAAIFVAGPIARLLAEPMGSLFWPRRYYDKPQPIYGIPQSKRARGLPEEALAEYEKLAEAFPKEVRPYLEMIDIAIVDLKDPDQALAIYQRGIALLKNPEDQDMLARGYAATRTWLDAKPPRPPLDPRPRHEPR